MLRKQRLAFVAGQATAAITAGAASRLKLLFVRDHGELFAVEILQKVSRTRRQIKSWV